MVIVCLLFLTDCQTAFQRGCTILHVHQQCMSHPISLHPCQHLVVTIFFLFISQLVYLFEIGISYEKSLFPSLTILTTSLRK